MHKCLYIKLFLHFFVLKKKALLNRIYIYRPEKNNNYKKMMSCIFIYIHMRVCMNKCAYIHIEYKYCMRAHARKINSKS